MSDRRCRVAVRGGGEYWTTNAQAGRDERTAEWEAMLSATHLPWTVQVDARRDEDRPFEARVRRAGGSTTSPWSTANAAPARAPGSVGS
jgi:hypothetical protein